jgi:hypothetical protein
MTTAEGRHPGRPARFDAVGLGAVRAMTVRLWREGGAVLARSQWVTVALWLAGFGIHAGVDAAAHISSNSELLYIGVTWAAQRLVLSARARHPGQVADGPPASAGTSPPSRA